VAYELRLFSKRKFMRKERKGPPAGSNKQEESGVRPVMPAENLEGSDELTKDSTTRRDNSEENFEEQHPSREKNRKGSDGGSGHQD